MKHPSVPRILVVGSINMDLVLQMDRAPAAGENVLGRSYSFVCGGKGANQAVAAARLGAKVDFVARVGRDVHGDRLRRGLEEEGIATKFVTRDGRSPSGLAVILVDGRGQNRIVVYSGANMTFAVGHVEKALRNEYDALMLQLEVPDEVVAASFAAARKKRIPVILDAGPARPFDLSLVRGIDIISPNQHETTVLTGLPCKTYADAKRAGRRLQKLSGAEHVVIKMGAAGAFLMSGNCCEPVPAFKIKPLDPTAAGDSFTAGMVIDWLRTGNLRQAVRYGNAAGALTATRLGAQTSLPQAKEVVEFLERRKQDLVLKTGSAAEKAP